MTRQEVLRQLIYRRKRRLQMLREKEAFLGSNTPPEILTEIEDLEAEVEELEESLLALATGAPAAAGPGCGLMLPVAIVVFALVGVAVVFIVGGGYYLSPTPEVVIETVVVNIGATATAVARQTATAIAEAAATPTPARVVVVAEAAEVSEETRRGQLTVNHPLRMSPGSSDSFFASLRIPEQYVSLIPMEIEIITVPENEAVEVGAREEDIVDVMMTQRMRLELIGPAFDVVTADPPTQTVKLERINEPVFWTWSLVAPETIGLHNVTLRIYQIQGEQKVAAIPPRIYEIEVVVLTPTPGPTATWTPVPTSTPVPTATPVPTPTPTPVPFMQTPLGTTVVGGGFTIVAALIGLVGIYLGRERLPYINSRASKQRRLEKLYRNKAYLEEQAANYGPNEVPVKLHNDIEAMKEEIEALEGELREG